MKYRSITRRAVGLAVLIASVAGGTAHAATTGVSACAAPNYSLFQPFTSLNDANWYTLAPGQSPDSFDGTGWTLTGGATLATTTLADGSTGTVLDLPPGGQAVSPPMCVSSAYPTARSVVRDLHGKTNVNLFVQYTNTKSWLKPISAGAFTAKPQWNTSQRLDLHPGDLFGWQNETFTLTGSGKGEDAQVYDLYIDPHCRL